MQIKAAQVQILQSVIVHDNAGNLVSGQVMGVQAPRQSRRAWLDLKVQDQLICIVLPKTRMVTILPEASWVND